jgi:hypothetical protein
MSSAPSSKDQPLGMTVHSLPELENLESQTPLRTRGGRLKMLLLLAICASPVVASYFTYYVIRPEGRRNFGALIEPQRTLPNLQAHSLNGKPINMMALKGQWLLMSVASGACDEACASRLYLQRQLREGLGKEKDRLDWVWIVSDVVPISETLKPALKEATVLRVPEADVALWLEPEAGQTLSSHLYLVDPLGNWMMRFPADIDAKTAPQVKRDLERLMRASVSWDTAGRPD